MNRKVFLAAVALGVASSFGGSEALAQSAGIVAPGTLIPGVNLTKGTITYNNQTGTRDSFSVGMSTNLGANVSSSSTSDYSASGTALFGLSGTSNLRQEIGTSRTTDQSFSQLTNYQTEASRSAETAALNATSTTYSSDVLTAVGNLSGSDTKVVNGKTYTADNKAEITNDRINSAEYKNAYSSEYEAAYSRAASSSYGSGVISGEFVKNAGTTTTTQTTSGATSADSTIQTKAAASALSSVESEYTTTTDQSTNTKRYYRNGTEITSSGSKTAEQEWTQQKQSSYDSYYGTAMNSLSQGAITTTSSQTGDTKNNVTVRGVGSAANLTTSAASKFESNVNKLIDTKTTVDTTTADVKITTVQNLNAGGSSGTASANSGGSLSSSSYADANSTTFTSSFVQAY